MEIVNQTIRIIDYENNAVYKRDTPDEFSDYVRQENAGCASADHSLRQNF